MCFIRFFGHENIGLDTKVIIPCKLELDILSKLDFRCDNFEKWPKPILSPNFCSGNIVNITHRSPLIKIVPLVESSEGGGGGTRTNSGPWTIINQDVNKKKIDEAEWRPF